MWKKEEPDVPAWYRNFIIVLLAFCYIMFPVLMARADTIQPKMVWVCTPAGAGEASVCWKMPRPMPNPRR